MLPNGFVTWLQRKGAFTFMETDISQQNIQSGWEKDPRAEACSSKVPESLQTTGSRAPQGTRRGWEGRLTLTNALKVPW